MSERAPNTGSTLPEAVLAWMATLLSCAYLYWAYTTLASGTTALESALGPREAQLPGPTRFVLDHHVWLYPVVLGSTALLLVAKEIVLRSKRLTLALTLSIALVSLFVADSFKTLLLAPLVEILAKCR
jgi:hypothetical protein